MSEVTASRPGEYRVTRPGHLVVCPWHAWEFDVTTGQSWCDPERLRARRYRASVAAGSDVGADAAAERVPGPFTVETYPVEVERDYVVVHLGEPAAEQAG